MTGALVVAEEEELVSLERAAQEAAELVALERIDLLGEVVRRIKGAVAKELEDATMKRICAALGIDTDNRTGRKSIVGIEVVGDNTKFAGGIRVGDSTLLQAKPCHPSFRRLVCSAVNMAYTPGKLLCIFEQGHPVARRLKSREYLPLNSVSLLISTGTSENGTLNDSLVRDSGH
ncbi:hypothetical protein [Granulicella sp. dw_53]|uniref:hypothetical protein n=1 Tax=Granulicella sp. dw_53 TaxID=2719792 RepID=UPI002106F896|nr:hypothetical protein [Granulicella sp. dw_53]